MTDYSVREEGGVAVECVHNSYLPKNAVSLDGVNVNVNLRKRDVETRKLFGWFPCSLSGEGNIPDVSTLNKVDGVWVGALEAQPASRVISYRAFRSLLIADGVIIPEIFAAAKTDPVLEDFLVTARSGQNGGTVDLDDPDTSAGLTYLERVGTGGDLTTSVPSVTQGLLGRILA